ncbi:rhomboid family intramembrane serine protease [Alloyangia pacifica]|uniref:Membrane associated serine protease, rhomboid family n=1 Tax=Alloyangia pacifica TaxID=311180 RepID=A0A1I6RDL4_9RHOB|nr:rhomboid family intramembrane serine protease [Alloyangia pacifica]SDG47604.1 Membrane associated serine protease, rhomboid family [Alloyangia pacifica]SFS62827.1 Membrane associated serine protease, rhomboid family [Alloyangia pacifica]
MFPIRDHNPSGRTPYVTYALIIANTVIFLGYWSLFSDPRALDAFFERWALFPSHISEGYGYTGILTSMFLHGGFMHLFGNMLFLFIFGDNIEDMLGHLRYLLFYLASGVAAALLQYVADPGSAVPTVGASGAIAGVMGAYLLLFPKARVDILIILIIIFKVLPIPAWLLLAVWFGMQIFSGIGSAGAEGGVAYWAHVGGFVAGLVMIAPVWLARGGPAFWNRTHGVPPHPAANYAIGRTHIPRAGARQNGRKGPWSRH